MQITTADKLAALVQDGDTVLIGGSGGGHAVPDALIAGIERRFLETSAPNDLTILTPVGIGDEDRAGLGRLAHKPLLKRVVCGALIDSPPVERMVLDDTIEAYTLPMGSLSQLMREMAGGRPGLVTHVGLNTFADPRFGGGKQSPSATEDIVQVVTLAGREWLFYPSQHVDICLLRGTTADEDGNITMEEEAVFAEVLSMAQAARRCGAIVAVQVKRMAKRNTLPAKQVKIPGIFVDFVIVEPDQPQTYVTRYSPAYAGELRIPVDAMPRLEAGPRKVIARRAAMELIPGAVCNIGAGISTGIPLVCAEEGVLEDVILSNEQGLIGGAPAMGVDAGAAINYAAMVDQCYQFDFYDGGGLDIAFLSFAEVDEQGNANVSRFADRVIGFGGFINISQNARRIVFSGTFTAGGLDIAWPEGKTEIRREGRSRKFVKTVTQLAYNAAYGAERGQEILYVTERAVFRRTPRALELVEIAPGIDMERDVFAHMAFRPVVSESLRNMPEEIFRPEPIGLEALMASRALGARRALRLGGEANPTATFLNQRGAAR